MVDWEGAGIEVLDAEAFEGTCLERNGGSAVGFGATWCLPTRGFVPKFVARTDRLGARTVLADIPDLESPLWDTFSIQRTPTIVVFRDGRTAERLDGRRIVGLRNSDRDRRTEMLSGLSPSATPTVPPR
jgi:hypothetical protein